MDFNLFISFIAVLLNIFLSIVIPCLLKDSEQTFLNDFKKVFNTNKELILASNIILFITVYISLQIAPSLNIGFSNFTGIPINNNSGINNDFINNPELSNLIPLKNLFKLRLN